MGEELKLILSNSLKGLRQGEFQVLCLSFLPIYDQRYEGLRRHGGTAEGKTRGGTPDLLKTDSGGSQIAVQCSVEEKYWRKPKEKTKMESWKPCADIIKCVNELKGLNEIVLCATGKIPTNAPNVERDVVAFGRTKTEAKITIITLYTLEEELFNNREKYIRVIEQHLPEFYKCLPKIKYFELLDNKLKSLRFSLTFPRLLDFENNLVYIDKRRMTLVSEIIENKSMCLIFGRPASGKTVLTFVFGRDFAKDYIVYYLDIKREFAPDELMKEIKSYDSDRTLYIIDDCHKSPDDVYELINLININHIRAKFLFVSRNIRTFLGKGENYFEVLKGCTISIKADQTAFKNIISLYEDYKCKGLSDYTRKEYDVNAIMKKCGQDLFILYYFLDAWNPKETRGSLNEVKEEEILDKISEKYLEPYDRKIERNRLLVSLSALYQFEFPIESPFIYSQITGLSENDRGDILNEGFIEVRKEKDETLYFLPHSTFASLILKTVEKKNKELLNLKSAQDYTEEICQQYLATKPKYILDIVRLLFNNNRKDIAQKYAENDYFVQKVNERFSEFAMTSAERWLRLLNQLAISERYKKKILDIKTIKEIADKLKIFRVQRYNWFFRELLKFDESKAKLVFKYSRSTLKDRLKDEKFKNIVSLFYCLTKIEISPHAAMDLLNTIDNENLLRKIEEGNLTNFGILLKHLATIDRSLALNNYFLNRLTAEKLSGVFRKKKVTIQHLYDIFRRSNRTFATEFAFSFDEDFFIKVYNNSRLKNIGRYHNYCLKYNPAFTKAYEVFERDDLYKILRDSSIREIGEFVFGISRTESIGATLARNAINELKKIDLTANISRVEFNKDMKAFDPIKLIDIMWLIHNVNLFENSDFITNQLKNVDLTLQLRKDKLETISQFVWNVFKVDKNLARKYCKIVYKSGLKEKIQESTLNEVNLFLWNIYQMEESLPDVFVNDEIRRILVRKLREGNFIESLRTIGIFEIAKCSILSYTPKLKINEGQFEDSLEDCLGHPYTFLLVLKGLKTKDEKMLIKIFRDNSELGDKILDFLKTFIDPETTRKTQELLNEIVDFLGGIIAGRN
jgi:hypothetical protein